MAIRKSLRQQRPADVRIPVPHSSWLGKRSGTTEMNEIVRPEDFWARLGV